MAGSGTDKAYVKPSKKGYSHVVVDYLFSSIVLPNITYALSVFGISESELTANYSPAVFTEIDVVNADTYPRN